MTKHIVLIHGTWCDGNVWGSFADKITAMGLTVHTPSLRYHDLTYEEVEAKVGAVSLTDYADDLVALVDGLPEKPILLGHSLGCLLAQMVAERTEVAGMILMGPAPTADIFALYPTMVRCFIRHFLRWGFWKKPMPPYKVEFFNYCMNVQDPELKEDIFKDLVPESGKVYTQMAFPFADKTRASYVDFSKIKGPVLVITGSEDKMTVSPIARKTARNYPGSLLVSITGADHMYETGKFQDQTLAVIRDWLGQKQFI
ncbi:alpha/beta fold hydrolase [Streptococcus moroccensis]|uniref:Pimeloyl-ACP methyl ester carboxylesterase n=1 Tax=Streptococcus moroccensis TaxID=1451356 RepID=A0ABT9YSV9_9STRE|nr:alpha/beta hydrolase [Streptococcus moroccensis]MDQ0223073.1 pimeloyl-ACP methyl ester carboxylesterase [Streptococcus moroccensis]